MSPDELHARLKMLFVAMYNQNYGERSNAASAIYRFLIDQHIHAEEIDLLVGRNLIERNKQAIAYLENEVKRLASENAYLRRHALPQTLREAVVAGSVDLARWFALYDTITEEFGDPLPFDWQRKVAKLIDVPPSMIRRWEDGLVQVPDDALEKLRNIARPAATKRRLSEPTPRLGTTHRPIKQNQFEILRAINDNPGCTIRNLSIYLYGEPDTNSVLADAVSTMLAKKWVWRNPIKRATAAHKTGHSKWQYYIAPLGTQLLNENSAD